MGKGGVGSEDKGGFVMIGKEEVGSREDDDDIWGGVSTKIGEEETEVGKVTTEVCGGGETDGETGGETGGKTRVCDSTSSVCVLFDGFLGQVVF